MLNTVTWFCMCPCFCKNHIYFTIFVDEKNELILIVFFYLNRTDISILFTPNYVQKFWLTKNHIISNIKVFDIQLILILIHMTRLI